jgi:hypothetical protein
MSAPDQVLPTLTVPIKWYASLVTSPTARNVAYIKRVTFGKKTVGVRNRISVVTTSMGFTNFITSMRFFAEAPDGDVMGNLVRLTDYELLGVAALHVSTDSIARPIFQAYAQNPWASGSDVEGSWAVLERPMSREGGGLSCAFAVENQLLLEWELLRQPRRWVAYIGVEYSSIELPTTEWREIARAASVPMP